MIKLPSITSEYTLIFSGDPALDLPAVPVLADDATAEAQAEARNLADERAQLLKVARDTGNWDAIIKPGEKPSLFQMRHLNKAARDFLDGENARRKLATTEFATLVFRLAVFRIDNLDGIKVEHDRCDGFLIAKPSVTNALAKAGSIGDQIIAEISGIAAQKTFQVIDPLS